MSSIDEDVARLRHYIADRADDDESTRLPPEPKLCEVLGMSRGRLRTVLKRLESEGLIWRHVGKGTFIGPRHINVDDANLSASISVYDLLDARLVLEPQLTAQAAIHATPADIAAMERCLSEMESVEAFMPWKRLDERLHNTIAEATHNAVLVMLHNATRTQMRHNLDSRIEAVYAPITEPRKDADEEHRQIVDAIRAHNPDRAEQAVREHLQSLRTRLFGKR